MTCPNCGSSNLQHKDHDQKHANDTARHVGAHQVGHAIKGHPAGLIFVAGCWVASKLVHAASKPWTCKNCRHTF